MSIGRANTRKKKGKLYRIFFVRPKREAVMDELAEKLIELRFVQEVFLEDNNSGYEAKIRFFANHEQEKPEIYISRNLSKDFGTVVRG